MGVRDQVAQAPDRLDAARVRLLAKHALLYDRVQTAYVLVDSATVTTYIVLNTDHVIYVNTTTAPVTLTLPDPAQEPGREYIVKKITTSVNAITLSPAVGNVEGAASYAFGGGALTPVRVHSDGTAWWLT